MSTLRLNHRITVLALAIATIIGVSFAYAQNGVATADFAATLSGSNQPASVSTNTTGDAEVVFVRAGNTVTASYVVRVYNGTGLTAAHLHCGGAGTNGPVVAWLWRGANGPTDHLQGELEKSIVTNSDVVRVTDNGQCPMNIRTVADIQEAARNGYIYVNVHSSQHPDGVVRGQLQLIGEGTTGGTSGTTGGTATGGTTDSGTTGGTTDSGGTTGSTDTSGTTATGGTTSGGSETGGTTGGTTSTTGSGSTGGGTSGTTGGTSGSSAEGAGSVSCHLLDASAPAPAGYGAAFDVFSDDREVFLSAECWRDAAEITLGSDVDVHYIYKTGYAWNGATWEPFTYQGARPAGQQWLVGEATHTFSHTEAELQSNHFFVGYICTWVGGAERWRCGCSDQACADSTWQIQGYRVDASVLQTLTARTGTESGATTGGTSGGTNGEDTDGATDGGSAQTSCVVGGCSGELCLEEGSELYSNCEYKAEYACYQDATCERQPSGDCGWTQTAQLTSCIEEARGDT